MYFKDLFYFFHYNLVTLGDTGQEFHQQFKLPTIVLQWHTNVKSKYTDSNKAKSSKSYIVEKSMQTKCLY